MLRLLKMLVLPLVAVSMVAGVCSLRESSKHSIARLARLTFVYYSLRWVLDERVHELGTAVHGVGTA